MAMPADLLSVRQFQMPSYFPSSSTGLPQAPFNFAVFSGFQCPGGFDSKQCTDFPLLTARQLA